LSTAAIVAAIVEGIRWTGCEAIDLGAASVPCAEFAIEQLGADGGIYLGNPTGAAHTLGMKFWIGRKRINFQLPADNAKSTPNLLDRPARSSGPLRSFHAGEGYLNELRPAYHALRPLRFVLRCTCEPVVSYLTDLLQNVACRLIPSDPSNEFAEQISKAKAHFGIEITNDGEECSVFDERGQAVTSKRLKLVLPTETDALRTLTHLLVLLSRDDRSFSAVLDRADAAR
jgi:phosphomannomutase